MRGWARRHLAWLAFVPSLSAGVAGAALLALWPFPYEPRLPLFPSLAMGAAAGALLLGGAAVLERRSRSFRWASRATERAVAQLQLSRPTALALAVSTSLGEELLFRGVLLPGLGLVPQALAFGLLHPAGRKGWSYPLYAAAAALVLGGVVLVTGRLLPAILAHLVVNATGLLGVTASRPRGRRGRGRGDDEEPVSPGAPPAEPPLP